MWVIFEGLDKSGKGTLEWGLLRATNFKHMVIDRGPVGYMTFDVLFNRSTGARFLNFVDYAQKAMETNDFLVVYCKVDKDVALERIKANNEECPYDYERAQRIYDDYIGRFYYDDMVVEIDTTNKSVDECVELIIKKLQEV